ncbi:MAG: FAD-dependent oxidoreductase [Negativicutes bacterium]|nr:FAD-dependent oxidoreductase [Negativicutes bacterium]
MTVKNRVMMAPVATNFADHSGGISEQMIHYYCERARGGVGLIIVENANVDWPEGVNGAVQLRIDEDRFIPGLGLLREALHDAEPTCRVALQINHPGAATKAGRTGGLQVVGPSDVPVRPLGEVPRPLTAAQIEALAGKYALAALRAKKAGFDAVEVHGGFCYLLAQFLSPFHNRRTDDYGGSPENRLRFPVMIIRKVRELVGRNFPVLFRLNADEFIEGGITLADSRIYARVLEQETVDLLHVTAGSGYSVDRHIEPMSYPQAWKAYLAAEIKKEVTIPVATVGTIREPQVADELIAAGKADFVALGRTLIADPHWVNKSARGEAVNRCISCNVCAGRRLAYDLPVRCSVNPTVGSEKIERERNRQTVAPKKVLVIGGGPAGLRAALETSKDGHRVVLVERDNVLGGRGLIAAVPPHKEKVAWLIADLVRQVENSNIEVKMGTAADMTMIRAIRPDVVILAAGSDTCLPPVLTEAEAAECMLAEDVLKKAYQPSGLTIGVIGGGSVGCECAEYLAGRGNSVYIYEMMEEVAADADPISRGDLLKRLAENHIMVKTGHCVQDIRQGTIACRFGADETKDRVDLIVVATGTRMPMTLVQELSAGTNEFDVYVIGDCFKPGRFVDASRQAYMTAGKIRNG